MVSPQQFGLTPPWEKFSFIQRTNAILSPPLIVFTSYHVLTTIQLILEKRGGASALGWMNTRKRLKKWKPREGILHGNAENSLKVNNLGQLLLTTLFKITMWSIGRMPKSFVRSVITGLVLSVKLFGSEREHLTLWTETRGPTICHIFMIHLWRHQLPRGRHLVTIVGNRSWINQVNSHEVLCPRARNCHS